MSKKDAVEVLEEVLSALHLSNDYTTLVGLKTRLKEFEKQYREITDDLRSLSFPRKYEDVHNIRTELNFLYRDISDELSFEINRTKIYYEEYKTVQRAASIENIKNDETLQEKFKAKSTSALRDIVGADGDYEEYVALASISYGLFQNLISLLNSIRMTTDTLAAECKNILSINIKDVK